MVVPDMPRSMTAYPRPLMSKRDSCQRLVEGDEGVPHPPDAGSVADGVGKGAAEGDAGVLDGVVPAGEGAVAARLHVEVD